VSRKLTFDTEALNQPLGVYLTDVQPQGDGSTILRRVGVAINDPTRDVAGRSFPWRVVIFRPEYCDAWRYLDGTHQSMAMLAAAVPANVLILAGCRGAADAVAKVAEMAGVGKHPSVPGSAVSAAHAPEAV
jgi:hypothetical protein